MIMIGSFGYNLYIVYIHKYAFYIRQNDVH